MKLFLIPFLVFSSTSIAEANNLDETFLNITLNCRTYRIFDSPDKSKDVETVCIRNKIEENNLSKAEYNKWNKRYYKKQTEAWNKFFKTLEKE